MSTTLLSDRFDGSSAVTLQAHTANAGAWSKFAGPDVSIVPNEGRASFSASEAWYEAATVPSSADGSVEAQAYGTGVLVLTFRRQANGDYYQLAVFSSQLQLFTVIAGSASVIASTIVSAYMNAATNKKFRVDFVGTSIKVFSDDVEAINTANGAITAAGRMGIKGSNLSLQDVVMIDGTGAAPPPSTRSLTLRLFTTTAGSTAVPNLTGLHWAFFDQSTVGALGAPSCKGTTGTTSASGDFVASLPTTALAAGATGWLVVADPATGKAFAGAAVIA